MKFFKILLRNYKNSVGGMIINYLFFLTASIWAFFTIIKFIGCMFQIYINPILINHELVSPKAQAIISLDYFVQSILGAGVLIALGAIALMVYLSYYITLNVFKFFQMSYAEYKEIR